MLRRRSRLATAALAISAVVFIYWYTRGSNEEQIFGPALAPPRLDGGNDDSDDNVADESVESVHQQLELLEAEKLANEARGRLPAIRHQRRRQRHYEFDSGTVRVWSSRVAWNSSSGSLCSAQSEYEALATDVTVSCSRRRRLGVQGDGGWDFCDVGPFRPTPGACAVVSFGVGKFWEFDDEASSSLRCRVFTFDPSVESPSLRGSGVRFFRVGVAGFSGRQGNWTVDTIDNIFNRLLKNDEQVDILKLDVETSEWSALESASDAALSRVKQLALELHTEELPQWASASTSLEQYGRYIRVLRRLGRLGFRMWLSEPNWHGRFFNSACEWRESTCCRNVYFVNVRFLRGASLRAALKAELNDVRLLPGRQLPTLPTPLTAAGAEAAFFDVIRVDSAACKRRHRVGPQRDGGYELCFGEPFELKRGCRVYSFGVGDQFGFEDALANDFNCRVRMFDPSMSQVAHKRGPSEWFHPVGIGASDAVRDNGWRVQPLASHLAQFGDERATVDVLKIDVEFDEWAALETAVRDSSLKRVKQLVLETHTREVAGGRSAPGDFVRQLSVWYDLHRLGFRQWRHTENRRITFRGAGGATRPCCHEHSLINSNFLV